MDNLVLALSQGTLLTLALVTLAQFILFRDGLRRDSALAFGAVGIFIAGQWLKDAAVLPGISWETISSIALFAYPLALMQLGRHFVTIPKGLHRTTIAGFIVATSLLVMPSPVPQLSVAVTILYFGASCGLLAMMFLAASHGPRSALSGRMALAAIGTAGVVIAVVAAGSAVLRPPFAEVLTSVSQLSLAGAALVYFAAFAPPAPLRRYWRLSQMEDFLEAGLRERGDRRAETALDRLVETAKTATSASGAFILLRSGETDRFLLHDPDGHGPEGDLWRDAGSSFVTAWEERRTVLVRRADAQTDVERALMKDTRASSLVILPIQSSQRCWGLLALVLPHEPVFAEEVDNLLGILSHHTALHLDHLRNMTELEDVVGRLETKSDELAASNRELEMFAYAVSHDMKTPIVSLDWMLASVCERLGDAVSKDPEIAATMERMQHTLENMETLVADLLALARVGRGDAAPERISAVDVLADQIEELDATIQQKGARVLYRDEGLPMLIVDPTHLGQVLRNLIENAVKYGPAGRTRVVVQGRPHRANGEIAAWDIEVSDNGPGVPDRFKDRIFGIFERAPHASTEEVPGTGVGLALVRKILDHYGAQIFVRDEPDGGACFVIRCPPRMLASTMATGKPTSLVDRLHPQEEVLDPISATKLNPPSDVLHAPAWPVESRPNEDLRDRP